MTFVDNAMNRRQFSASLLALGMALSLPVSRTTRAGSGFDIKYFHDFSVPDKQLGRTDRPDGFWRKRLGEDAFRVLFEEATEPAFSSELDGFYEEGSYVCAACHLPLFSSDTKYDSHTGWPSFWSVYEAHIDTKWDFKMVWPRTEYHCIRCGGHQGHVFDDGPDPTGERWCNNGLALKFIPADEALPALR